MSCFYKFILLPLRLLHFVLVALALFLGHCKFRTNVNDPIENTVQYFFLLSHSLKLLLSDLNIKLFVS